MNEIVNAQTYLFITCIEIGVIMGMLYDLIRIFRKIIKHPNLFVQIEDLFYWIVCSAFGFYMIYRNNYGAIRFFAFVGIVLGGIFYFCTFSIVFMKIATWMIDTIKAAIRKLIYLISIPIKWVLGLLSIPCRYILECYEAFKFFKKKKIRKIKRKWYHTKAEIRTELRLMKEKK